MRLIVAGGGKAGQKTGQRSKVEAGREPVKAGGAPYFFIPHSAFDILHFGFRERTQTEMKNVECRMRNEEEACGAIC